AGGGAAATAGLVVGLTVARAEAPTGVATAPRSLGVLIGACLPPPRRRKRIGVRTITSAVRNSAKRVRLSMQAIASRRTAMVRDHTRPGGMGGNEQSGESPAMIRVP